MHEEEVQRFPHWFIQFVKSPLQSNCEMCGAFWEHFHDHFARWRDLAVQEFHSYLVDFSHLGEVEAASCEGLVTDCEVNRL